MTISVSKDSIRLYDQSLKQKRRPKTNWREALEKARSIGNKYLRHSAVELIIWGWADQRTVPHVNEAELNQPQNETARLCFKALKYLSEDEDDAARMVIDQIKDKALRVKMYKELLSC